MFNRAANSDPPRNRLSNLQPTSQPGGASLDLIYRLPLELNRAGDRAQLALWFQFECSAGPLTQGPVLHAALLPPSGFVRLTPVDRQTRFILETESIGVFRSDITPAENLYLTRLLKALHEVTVADPAARTVTFDDTRQQVQIEAIRPAKQPLTAIIRRFVQVTEACSRVAESIARTQPVNLPPEERYRTPAGLPRIVANPHPRRALTLFFYRINTQQSVRLVLKRIERDTPIADALRGRAALEELDRRLQAGGLIDAQGNVPRDAQLRWGWQRIFLLPTPHVLLKACPDDGSLGDGPTSREIKIDVWQYPGQTS